MRLLQYKCDMKSSLIFKLVSVVIISIKIQITVITKINIIKDYNN